MVKKETFHFLGLMFFGLLILLTSVFFSGGELITKTSFAVLKLKSQTTFSLIFGALALTILAFYLRIKNWVKY